MQTGVVLNVFIGIKIWEKGASCFEARSNFTFFSGFTLTLLLFRFLFRWSLNSIDIDFEGIFVVLLHLLNLIFLLLIA